MVRKSTKANTGDKGGRKRRGTRRRKDSSSDSEPEVNQSIREENVSEIALPKDVKSEETEEIESTSSSRGRNTRRLSKRNTMAKVEQQPKVEEEVEVAEGEWNEDETFWTGVAASEPVNPEANEEEGSTWKIQSSNGSGGEIQKLKICRQRPTDSTGSSPAKECLSPRVKRTPVPDKLENDSSTVGEIDTPMEIIAEISEKMEIVETSENIETELITPITEQVVTTEVVEEQHQQSSGTEEKNIEEAIIIPGLDLVGEGQHKQDHLWITSAETTVESPSQEVITEVSMIAMPPTEDDKIIDVPIISEIEIKNVESIEEVEDTSNILTFEEQEVSVTIETNNEDIVVPETTVEVTEEEQIVQEEEMVIEEVSEEQEAATVQIETAEELTSEMGETEQIMEVTTVTTTIATSPTPTSSISKCLSTSSLSVSSELAMEQIAKKLNERAARGKESLDDKEKPLIKPLLSPEKPENSPDLDRSIEEGEILSSAAATPDPQPSAKSARAIIKPKILEPDVKPPDVEELEESDGGEEITTEEIKEKSSPVENEEIVIKNKTEVEVTVSNDVKEIKKKIPIVIDTKSSTLEENKIKKSSQGPKLPVQENHKATRKISIVSADAKALRKSPSPSRKKATEVLYITNLVRPFTVPQLRELLARTGTIAQNGFYIDKIKSKCYVKYTDIEMAIETRHALHGVRWPVNNPKTLRVDFATAEDMAVVQKLADDEVSVAVKRIDIEQTLGPPSIGSTTTSGGWLNEQTALRPSRRVTATVREWDVGKISSGESAQHKTSPPVVDNKKKTTDDDWNRKKEKSSRPEKERDRRRAHSPDHKVEPPKKMKKRDSDAPAKLLDDLFRKTKATPCIYWLPLTAAQIAVKEEMRRQHMAEHERRLAELRKTDTSSRRDNKERERDRDRDRRKK